MKHTYEEVSKSFDLWGEYVDPDATMAREQFEEMTVAEKIQVQIEMFGKEEEKENNKTE